MLSVVQPDTTHCSTGTLLPRHLSSIPGCYTPPAAVSQHLLLSAVGCLAKFPSFFQLLRRKYELCLSPYKTAASAAPNSPGKGCGYNKGPVPRFMDFVQKSELVQKIKYKHVRDKTAGASQSQFYSGLVCCAGRSHLTGVQSMPEASSHTEV